MNHGLHGFHGLNSARSLTSRALLLVENPSAKIRSIRVIRGFPVRIVGFNFGFRVELDMRKGTADPRPETCHQTDAKAIQPVEHLGTSEGWRKRRQALRPVTVHHRLL